MEPIPDLRKFYWHANTSSGGTLSLGMTFEGDYSKGEKEKALADAIRHCHQTMENSGFIPYHARLMSPRDISEQYGKTRQYWEKLLNEGKILYKETAAGRITTDLWVQGYLGNKEKVDQYVRNVKTVLRSIEALESRSRSWQKVVCPVCSQETFSFAVNMGGNTNGICRNSNCGFHIHTVS